MRTIKYMFYILIATVLPAVVKANDCRCIEISAPIINKKKGIVAFNVTNNCIRRVWFSTKGFWMSISDEQETKTESKLFKLSGDQPEFLLFKWKSTQQIIFTSEKLMQEHDKINFSYSNTTDSKPRNMLGAKTFLCEVEIK